MDPHHHEQPRKHTFSLLRFVENEGDGRDAFRCIISLFFQSPTPDLAFQYYFLLCCARFSMRGHITNIHGTLSGKRGRLQPSSVKTKKKTSLLLAKNQRNRQSINEEGSAV